MSINVEDAFQECFTRLQWLMFGEDPEDALAELAKSQWSNMDIAYKCITCGLDKNCVICVSCFMNGNHGDHNYSIIHNIVGCCDCGDDTAWKPEGFCSNHATK
ncbi:hypothetical protein ACFE04_001371 [Oxalis oulophora]